MRKFALRVSAMVAMTVILVAGVVPGRTATQAEGERAVAESAKQEEIFLYIRSACAQRQADGRNVIEVEFTTDTVAGLTGMRMVTVFCGSQKTGFALTEENRKDIHRVQFTDTVQPETIRIEIRAHETEAGLMLICDGEGELCAEAVSPVNGERILQISGADPCERFRVYRIANLPEVLSGMVEVSSKPTVKEREAYAVPGCYATTLTADADGTALCNFSRQGLEDGLYLAVGMSKAFYICIPQVEATGEFRNSVVRLALREG